MISNFHVAKDATRVRLLTSAGLIDAKAVQTDAVNFDLLKAGRDLAFGLFVLGIKLKLS
jgi:hypothetical protein